MKPSRATTLVVLAHLVIVVPLAAILNVWQDEAYSLLTTGGSLQHAIHQAIFFEQNAPLYFIVLWAWRHVWAGYFWARMLSVACTAATIACVPALARRYAAPISPLYVTLAVAFNPLMVWAAVEIRSYALAILFGALILLSGHRAFVRPARASAHWGAFVLVGTLAAYTQYFTLFLVAGFGMALAARRSWTALARWGAACLGIAILFVPMLLMLPAQLAAFRNAYVGPANVAQSVAQLAKILFLQIFPVGPLPHHGAIAAAVCAAGVIALVLSRKAFAAAHWQMATAVLLFSAMVYALAVYVLQTHFDFRYGAFLFVPLMIAAFSLPLWWKEPVRRRLLAGLTSACLGLSIAALIVTYRPGAKIGDWQRVASYLQTNARQRQPILVFEAENAVPLQYYYRGPAPVVPIPQPVDFASYDVDRFVVHDAGELTASLAPWRAARRMWLVTTDTCHSLNVHYGCDVVERYVATHFSTVSDERFYRARVRLLER